MMRLLKLIGWLFGGLVSLLVVAVVVVPLVFDPNDHKARIAAQVQKHTGLAVRIDGDIGLTVFPWLGVTLGVVELGQAPGFAGDTFARTAGMQVRVKLLPLIQQKLEMDTVIVDGLELNLARNADGRGNWETIIETAAAAGGAPAADGGTAPATDSGPPVIAVLAIGGLDVRESVVRWNDAQSGENYTVSKLALKTGELDPTAPVAVSLAFDVEGGTPRLAGRVTLDASVVVDPSRQTLLARNLKLGADLPQAGPLGEAAKLAVSGDLALNGETNSLKFDGLVLDLDAGRLAALGGPAKVSLRGDLAASAPSQQVSLARMDVSADVSGDGVPGGKARITAKGDLSADLAAQRLTIAGLQGELADVAVLGAAAGLRLSGDFDADLGKQVYDLAGARFSGQVNGYPAADSKLAFDGGASLRLDATAKKVALADLTLDLPGLVMPGVAGDLRVATSLAGDYGAARYVASNLGIDGKLSGEAVKGRLGFKFSSAVEADLGANVVSLSGMRISGEQAGFSGDGSNAAFSGSANLRFDTAAQKLTLGDLVLDLPTVAMKDLAGRLRIAGALSGDTGKGRYVAKKLDLDGAFAGALVGGELDFKLSSGLDADLAGGAASLPGFRIDGNIAGADIPGGKLPFKIAANIGANLNSDTLDIGALDATAGPLKASGDLKVAKVRSTPSYSGRLALAKFDLRKLLALLGQPVPDTADVKALTSVSFNGSISGGADELALKPFTLGLDGSKIDGQLQMIGFARPAWRFDIDVDQIDADRYLPAQKPGDAAVATPGAAAGAAAGLPVETLRALDAKGELRIGSLKISNLRLAKIVVRLDGGEGLVRLSPLSARLYEGQYAGNVAIDARGAQPQISVDEQLTTVSLGPLLGDLKGIKTLSGRADVQLRATAVGGTADAIKQTLNGNATFRVADGEFRGIDIASTLCGLLSGGLQALGSSGFQSGEGGSTRFSDMTGSATVSNGVVVNPDLLARSPLLRLDGRGQANLITEQLDYTATANLVGSCQGQGGLSVAELSGIAVPVRVTGTFGKPKYGIDPGALIQALGKSKLQDVLQKSLGIPIPAPAAAAAPAPSAPASADSTRGLPPAGGTSAPTQGQQAQQPVDPKKQAIEGLLKGLFGN